MTRALQGVRVLDLSRVLAGPLCTMILGDLGAEVIKVERPGAGDDLRRWGPPFTAGGESAYFLAVNRNKKSITVNLQSPEGQELLRELARVSDVLVENMRPGTMERLGLSYEHLRLLNPRLIYCSITAFGSAGPYRDLPGYDLIVQAMGGLMSVTGEPGRMPLKVGVAIVDVVTGLFAALGILGALASRHRTGEGQRVEVSLLEAELASLVNVAANYLMAGLKPSRIGNAHPNVAPYEVFRARDGYLAIAVGNEEQWGRLCSLPGFEGLAADPRFATNADRVRHREALAEALNSVLSASTVNDWVERLRRQGIPAGPVFGVDEILESDHVAALGIVKQLVHPTAGPIRVVGSPLHMSRDSTEPTLPPPRLGEHTEAVLRELLGKSDDEIGRLRELGAI